MLGNLDLTRLIFGRLTLDSIPYHEPILVGVTLDETLLVSLALPEYLVSLLLASGRTLVGAEEAARRAA